MSCNILTDILWAIQRSLRVAALLQLPDYTQVSLQLPAHGSASSPTAVSGSPEEMHLICCLLFYYISIPSSPWCPCLSWGLCQSQSCTALSAGLSGG